MEIIEQYCVCDIETNTIKKLPDPLSDELRYVGFLYQTRFVCYHYTEIENIQKCLNYFLYIIGHNIKKYDKIVLERYGFKFPNNQTIIDTYEISENRLKSMLYIDLNVGDKSLKKLCERFNLIHKKGEFDYSLLKNNYLEGENLNKLKEYLFGDLNSCNDLFKYYYELFYGFKEYMGEYNQRKMCWLVNKPGSTAYKAVCHLTGLPEEYNDYNNEKSLYEGGYVSEPKYDFIEG